MVIFVAFVEAAVVDKMDDIVVLLGTALFTVETPLIRFCLEHVIFIM